MFEPREGEIALTEDPAAVAADAQLVFIGLIRSPWKTREDCPKNMAAARATGQKQRQRLGNRLAAFCGRDDHGAFLWRGGKASGKLSIEAK
jgi:hypothetical protein